MPLPRLRPKSKSKLKPRRPARTLPKVPLRWKLKRLRNSLVPWWTRVLPLTVRKERGQSKL